MNTCNNCKYIYNETCRRYPPQILSVYVIDGDDKKFITLYPATTKDSWCGEWDDATDEMDDYDGSLYTQQGKLNEDSNTLDIEAKHLCHLAGNEFSV